MRRLFTYLLRIDVFRVSSFNAVSVLLRLVFSYATNKVIVLWLGPAGTALTEQLRNGIQGLQGLSTLGISEAITRYTSLYRRRDRRLRLFIVRSGRLILAVAAALGLLTWLLAPRLAVYLLHDARYVPLIRVIGFLTPVYAYQVLLTAILNGLEQYKKLSYINILIHATGFLLTLWLVHTHWMWGALWAVALTPVAAFFLSWFLLDRSDLALLRAPLQHSAEKLPYFGRRIWPFVSMALVSAVMIPLVTIWIRNRIIDDYGPQGMVWAGYWDAVRKISAFYFMFITPVFAMHYFPRLSRAGDLSAWRRELGQMLRYFYPLVLAGLILIYLFRDGITRFVFSKQYLPVNDLYAWQLGGDAIRLFSLLLAYRMWAKALMWHYLFAEISYWLFYGALGAYFLSVRGLAGLMEAYVWANAYYAVLMLIYFGDVFLAGRSGNAR